MGKNIILLSDGTGNSAAKFNRTNVWRVYDALDLSDPRKQIAYYDDGVGTSSFRPLALLGGAIGYGLSRNVRELYAFLCRNYEPGDRIYGFGFSRGAFTIRILTGLISHAGILKRSGFGGEHDLWAKTSHLYRMYRQDQAHAPYFATAVRTVRDSIKKIFVSPLTIDPADIDKDIEIEFLGLWDTVEAYGFPIEEMRIGWDKWVWQLSTRNRDLTSKVKKAVHALCLDDERNTFHPLLWNETGDSGPAKKVPPIRVPQDCTHIAEERLTQVWFAGMHSDVGGGYPDDGMSYVPLNWVIGQTKPHLLFQPRKLVEYRRAARAAGVMHDSRRGLASYYRLLPRKIDKLTSAHDNRPAAEPDPSQRDVVKIPRPKIHSSVFERIAAAGCDYSPIVLPGTYAVVHDDGTIANPAGKPFEDAGQALERSQAQERVWDRVWFRRIVYFATVFLTACLVLLPWMTSLWPINWIWPLSEAIDAEKCIQSKFCFAAGVPKLLGAFLPSSAATWVDAFSANPGIFLILAAGIAMLMLASSFIDGAIHDHMRIIWRRAGPIDTSYTSLYRIRESKPYQWVLRTMKQRTLPAIFGISSVAVILFAAVTIVSRIWFSYWDGSGNFCDGPAGAQPIGTRYSAALKFDPSNPCWRSGLIATKGNVYRVVIDITGRPWTDGSLPADLLGNREDLPFYLAWPALPYKRYVREAYFQPVARIIDVRPDRYAGQDEYVLHPVFPSSQDPRNCLISDFTAASPGELLLFVNDVAVFGSKYFYTNNAGSADVYLKQIVKAGEKFTLPPGMAAVSACAAFVSRRD